MKNIQDYKPHGAPSIVNHGAYPQHLPPVTPLDLESRIQAAVKRSRYNWFNSPRIKYTFSLFRIASIFLGSVIATVYTANAIIVHDKEKYLKDLLKRRDDLL